MSGAFKRKSDKARGKAGKWSAWWRGADGKQKTRAGYTDKAATQELARRLEFEAAQERDGLIDPDLARRRDAARAPIAGLVDEYAAHLLAKGGGAQHARAASSALRRLLADAGAATLADLSADRVQAAAARIRAVRTPRTANYALVQARSFARWLVLGGRLERNPFLHLKSFGAHPDRFRVRRALTPEEAARLVAAAEGGPTLRARALVGKGLDVTGPERAMLYRIALGTGYRANEVRHLTPASFRLDADPPTIALGAEHTKDGLPAEQPIARALADRLRAWLRGRPPGAPVVPVPPDAARLIRKDLEAAGIAFHVDGEGDVDLHSLRGTYGTWLVKAGVDIKTVQVLMRHKNPLVTLQMYIKSTEEDRANAVARLPDPG